MKLALTILFTAGTVVWGQVQYAFTNFAGAPGGSGSANGIGSAARFHQPTGVTVDSAGNVYVADSYNQTIRKITPDAVVTTLAGSIGEIGSADGARSAAQFSFPVGVAVDGAGNVYVGDYINSTIRKITTTGAVTTLAGSARQYGSTDGTGSAARFHYPSGVAVDGADNVYVADTINDTIRKITPAGVVTTLAGNASITDPDGIPLGGYADGSGSTARFNGPSGVAVDSAGNAYVADTYNHTIRKITRDGVVTTLAGSASQIGGADGSGSAAHFNRPTGVAVDSNGNVYVADSANSTIRKVTPAGVVTTLAGSLGLGGSADGTGRAARFSGPEGVAVDSAGNVYVADNSNSTIRKITPGGVVTTLAGTAAQIGPTDGVGSAARFGSKYGGPSGVAVDTAGYVYVADYWNSSIRKITPAGAVATLTDWFGGPSGLAADSASNIYVAESGTSTIRKITSAGSVTTLAGAKGIFGSVDGTGDLAVFNHPTSVAVDSAGNVYVADRSNSTIRNITPAGMVTTLAGSPGRIGSADGTGSAARFHWPTGVAVDSVSNVYVADTDNHTIRKITPGGLVTTLAGSPGQIGSGDGTGSAARFYYPEGLAVDSADNVYVADSANSTIRKITPAGAVTTLAGSPRQSSGVDGIGSAARFSVPSGVAVDSAGNLYVADTGNHRITKGTPLFRFATSAESLNVLNGSFAMALSGPFGSNAIVESSANLRAWTPVRTNVLPPDGLNLSLPLGADPNQFFRARLAP
ncbi:MAG: hypothetical protein HYY24_19345 [Verrucomicrobia bacterium]|nr:hypothetical protein [Verrucomicrobiota bacterium]